MAAADAVGKQSLFRRGLNATRFALASAVTVVIVTVVIYAVVVVSRKEQLALSVAGGIIHVNSEPSTPLQLGLTFSVKANNPSGRVRLYYTDIIGRIVLKNGTNSTDNTFTFAQFRLGDSPNMDVAPVTMLQKDAVVTVTYAYRISTYFNDLRNGSTISDAMLKLNGSLIVGLYSMHNKTREDRTFYCRSLTIGAASNASAADAEAEDKPCFPYDPSTK